MKHNYIYYGIAVLFLVIGILSFALMARSANGCEFETDPIPDVPANAPIMEYDNEYNDETNLVAEEPAYLLIIAAIMFLLLFSGLWVREKVISLWQLL